LTSGSTVFHALPELKTLLRGQIGRGMIEGQELKNTNYNINPDIAFAKEFSSSSRASAMVVYPMQDPKTSGKASGSGEPPKPYVSTEKAKLAKSNYTMDIKIVKGMFRNNGVDFSPY
jgi:hypothetical protein